MRDVQKVIDDMIGSCCGGKASCSPERLVGLLAEFLHLAAASDDLRDDMKYSEPPGIDSAEIRKRVAIKCQGLGPYESLTDSIGGGRKESRDAADDLASVIVDLMKIKWYFEKTSRRNGTHRMKLALAGGLARTVAGLVVYFIDRERLQI